MTITGTNHFVNLSSAAIYYRKQGVELREVHSKVVNNEIALGKPAVKEGETLFLNVEEGRYFIGTK